MINRSESQLIARDQINQVQKTAGRVRKATPVRASAPARKKKTG